jgi:hypothetical protein
MSLSAEDLDAIAEGVARRLSNRADTRPWLSTAGQAAGLIAGAVAIVYLLGGLVLALRMIFDRFRIEEAVGVIAQLPQVFVVSAGFIDVIAVPALIGLIAGVLIAAHLAKEWPETWLSRVPHFGPARYQVSLALVLTLACVFRVVTSDLKPLPSVIAVAVTGVTSYVAVRLGWVGLRGLGLATTPDASTDRLQRVQRRQGDRQDPASEPESTTRNATLGHVSRSEAQRAFLGGAVWAAMTVPAVIVFFSIVGFEPARVCIRGSDRPLEGDLVANTRDQVLLLQRTGIRAVLTGQATRLSGSTMAATKRTSRRAG